MLTNNLRRCLTLLTMKRAQSKQLYQRETVLYIHCVKHSIRIGTRSVVHSLAHLGEDACGEEGINTSSIRDVHD